MLNQTDSKVVPLSESRPDPVDAHTSRRPALLDDSASTRSLYRAMLDACDHATIYHTLEWLDTFRGRGTRLQFIRLGDDAIVPFLCRGRGVLRRAYSLPYDTYGGIVGPANQPVLLDQISRTLGVPSIRIVDFAGRIDDESTLATCATATTHVVPLIEGYEAVRSRYADSCRRLVRQADKRGVTVSVMENDGELQAFHALHVRTVGRRGSRAFPIGFFRDVHENLVLRGLARFYLARQGHDIVGGNLVLRYRDRACDWMWVYDDRRSDLRVTNAMIDRAIQDEIGYGSLELNLGTSPDNRQGSVRFKRSFGALECPYQIFIRQGWGLSAAHRARAFAAATIRYTGV